LVFYVTYFFLPPPSPKFLRLTLSLILQVAFGWAVLILFYIVGCIANYIQDRVAASFFNSKNLHNRFSTPGLNASNTVLVDQPHLLTRWEEEKKLHLAPFAVSSSKWKSLQTLGPNDWATSGFRDQIFSLSIAIDPLLSV